jgi:hypothetical protein
MERYHGRTTTKEAVALKHVEKYFYCRTTDESIENNLTLAHNAIDQTERGMRNKIHKTRDLIEDKMLKYIANRWDDFVKSENVCSEGSKFPSVKADYEKVKVMDIAKPATTIIMLVGKEYVMRKDGVITRGTELDDEIRTKIGMLKLLDDDAFNSNLGIKVNSNLFVLI